MEIMIVQVMTKMSLVSYYYVESPGLEYLDSYRKDSKMLMGFLSVK